jgi:nucleoside 2-deoxyribosyltransferase
VLAPDKGWLYIPPQKIHNPTDYEFRLLPSEEGMSIKEIEDDFLSSVRKSDFLYVVNPEGYIGETVSMEIGFALALDIPVFLQEKMSQFLDLDERWDEIIHSLKVCTIQEAIAEIEEQRLLSK